MSWVRIDDKIAFHRKVVKAGNEAFGAWVRMNAYSADHRLDGHVPADVALMIAGTDRGEVVARLCTVGLLEQDGDDYAIHDYHDYNPTSEEVETERENTSQKKATAGKAGGIASGVSRRKRSSAKQEGSTSEAKRSPVPVPASLSLNLPSLSSPSDAGARVANSVPDLGEPDSDKQRRIVDKHAIDALEVLGQLNAARSRVRPSSRGIRPTYSSLGGIAARLAAGRTLEECLLVVAAGESECTRKPDAFDWLDAVSPWRPENFERRLAADSSAPRGRRDGAITAVNFVEAGDKTAEYT